MTTTKIRQAAETARDIAAHGHDADEATRLAHADLLDTMTDAEFARYLVLVAG